MKCPFCSTGKNDKLPEINDFDKPQEHLIITIKNNHTHVHGPFQNEIVIRTMIKSLIAEAEKNGIPWRPVTEHQIGS